MRRHFLDMLEYDRWATLRLLDLCEPGAPDTVRRLFSHLVLEREAWIMRVVSGQFEQEVWSLLPWPEIRHKMEVTQREFNQFLSGLDNREFHHYLEWSPSPAHEGTSLMDILSHVSQVGGVVRGRIIQLLEQSGSLPPDIQFLTYSARKPAPVIYGRFGKE